MRSIIAAALLSIACCGHAPAQTVDTSPPTTAEISAGIDGLRDEALQLMGWVYGNMTGLDGPSYDIRRKVGPYGTLYPALVERGDRAANISRFNDWVLIGSRYAYDEEEVTRRLTRVRDIFAALKAISEVLN